MKRKATFLHVHFRVKCRRKNCFFGGLTQKKLLSSSFRLFTIQYVSKEIEIINEKF